MSDPVVSVITTFLNAERFIVEAIESVLAQTFNRWELLLVDDGSADASSIIAKDYAARFPERVRYLEHAEHANRGKSASRNFGVAQARGHMVAFLDADDVYLPHKLEKQVAIMAGHREIGLVLSPSLYWTPEDGGKRYPPMTLSPGPHPAGSWPAAMLQNDENIGTTCGVLIRRDLALQSGGFEESWDLFEDQVLWYKIGLSAPIYFDPEPVALYRQHPASSWSAHTPEQRLIAQLHFYSWLADYLRHRYDGPFKPTALAVRLQAIVLRHFVGKEQFTIAVALAQAFEIQFGEPPPDPEWQYLVAFSFHQERSSLPEALRHYDLALEQGFDEFWVRYNRGALHEQLGNVEQARADLRRAVALKPDHEGAQQLLLRLGVHA